jgi:uncharacterized membrane protein YkoI
MKIETFSKKLVRKKVLVPAIIGVGILLSAAFIVTSPLENTWAQQQQWGNNKTTNASHFGAMPKINGSVNVGDGIKNFFAENAKTPFITGAQTAQEQIANGTVLGGHIGVTQGNLTYTYFVVNPTNDTAHKVIIDAGNGQVLHTSESKQIGSGGQSMFGSFEHRKGHEGFGGSGGGGFGPFGGFWHNK